MTLGIEDLLASYLSNSKHLQHHHNLIDQWIPINIIMEYKSLKENTINEIVAASMAHSCIQLNDNFTALKWIGNSRGKLKRVPKHIKDNTTIFKCELPPMDKQTIKTIFVKYGNVRFIDQHVDSDIAYIHLEMKENLDLMENNAIFAVLEDFQRSYPSFKLSLLNFNEKETYLKLYKGRNHKSKKKKRTTKPNSTSIKKSNPLPAFQVDAIVNGMNKL